MDTAALIEKTGFTIRDFAPIMERLTGLTLLFYDFKTTLKLSPDLQLPGGENTHTCGYCLAVKTGKNSRFDCSKSDGVSNLRAVKEMAPQVNTCYAGVNEIVYPVFQGKRYLGCLVAGQAFFKRYSAKEKMKYMEVLNSKGIDEGVASAEFDKMKRAGAEEIALALKLMRLFAGYVVDAVREAEKKELRGIKKVRPSKTKLDESAARLRQRRKRTIIDRVLETLAEQQPSQHTLSAAAALAGVSPCHFSRLFSAVTGKSFRKYFLSLRMEKAKQLLAKESLKIFDIAESCGYKELSSFSRAFNKETGQYPGTYRAGLLPERNSDDRKN